MNKVNAIVEYETEFNGNLKFGYKKDEDFLNDLNNEVETNGTNEISEYYKSYSKSMNDTNTTFEKRLGIQNLIELLDK